MEEIETKEIDLFWHKYKFFPYEKKLAIREINTLLLPQEIIQLTNKVTVCFPEKCYNLDKLVFFSHALAKGNLIETKQFKYENGSRLDIKLKKQNTRYSAHGLHEYKGKFNPQVVRSLYNIFNIQESSLVLDPFCGSGTSLVEAAHHGIKAIGTDINPLAVFITNTKINSLKVSVEELHEGKAKLFDEFTKVRGAYQLPALDARLRYLNAWFPMDVLLDIETIKAASNNLDKMVRDIFLVIMSNLLREYSLQDPNDLRIRRRKTPLPKTTFIQALNTAIDYNIKNFEAFQTQFGLIKSDNHAVKLDIRDAISGNNIVGGFDFAITSPPYATALPYIDTQRLSLVWLEMIQARDINYLESELIGSREFKVKADHDKWSDNLARNTLGLPEEVFDFCLSLMNMLDADDGFRRKALPSLLYRYFNDMSKAFTSVYNLLKDRGHFALIVGHNHTKIGGKRTDINTPYYLGVIGESLGFHIQEVTPLEAYQRYGLNASNAVEKEALIVFTK